MNPDTFKNRLNTALSIRQMKPAELAEKTGLNKSRISQYVNGVYEAKQDGVYIIAKALNVNEAWLMGYDCPMERCDQNTKAKSNNDLAFLNAFQRLDAEDQADIYDQIQYKLSKDKYKRGSSLKNA